MRLAVEVADTPQCTRRRTSPVLAKLIELSPTAESPDQADSLARPLARRDLRMARPARVDIRARKPCLRARRLLLGWNVLLLTEFSFVGQSPGGSGTQDSKWRGDNTAAPKHDKARGGQRTAATRPPSHTVVVYPQVWTTGRANLVPFAPLYCQLLHTLWINVWTNSVIEQRRRW